MEITMEIEHTITYWNNGNKKAEWWKLNGKYHRVDGPAVIYYYESNEILSEYWHINGGRHRIDAPALTHYYKSGNIEREVWCFNGEIHNIEGPAYICYCDDVAYLLILLNLSLLINQELQFL